MLFGHDIIWGLFTIICNMAWFFGVGLFILFLYKFKPTRKLINKYFEFY